MAETSEKIVELKVRKLDGTEISLGTGVAVAKDSIVTVRHVIENFDLGQIVAIRYPNGHEEEPHKVHSPLIGEGDRDALVLLKIQPHFSDDIGFRIQNAIGARGKQVHFLGFPRNPVAKTEFGVGFMVGHAAVKGSRAHWIQINTEDAKKGMSGGPVFQPENGHLLGFISESIQHDEESGRSKILYALNAIQLTDSPFSLPFGGLQDAKRQDGASGLGPLTLDDLSGSADRTHQQTGLHPRHSTTQHFVGRRKMLDEIELFWNKEGKSTDTALTIFGLTGTGKTSLVEHFLGRLHREEVGPAPDFVFQHSFDTVGLSDGFFECLKDLLPREYRALGPRQIVEMLTPVIESSRGLVILDAIENHLDDAGEVIDPDLAHFIAAFEHANRSKLIILSQRKPRKGPLSPANKRHRIEELAPFTLKESEELYEEIVGETTPVWLGNLHVALGGHPQPLVLIIQAMKRGHIKNVDEALRIIRESSVSDDPLEGARGALFNLLGKLTNEERTVMMLVSQLSGEFLISRLSGQFTRTQLAEILSTSDFDADDGLFDRVSENALPGVVSRLEEFLLISPGKADGEYESHQFIRRFFAQQFEILPREKRERIHMEIAKSYRRNFNPPAVPHSIVDVEYGLQTVAHLCRAGQRSTAFNFLHKHVQRGPERQHILSNELGAVSTLHSLLRNFFEQGDVNLTPLLLREADNYTLLHYAGYCESVLGRPESAKKMLRLAAKGIAQATDDSTYAMEVYRSAAYCAAAAGALAEANSILKEAEPLLSSIESEKECMKFRAHQLEIAHMTSKAPWHSLLADTEAFAAKHSAADVSDLLPRGTQFIHVLVRLGRLSEARNLLEKLQVRAEERGWTEISERCHSLRSIIAEGELERRSSSELYKDMRTKVERVDLIAEITIRRARYLISNEDYDGACSVLENEMKDLQLNGYKLLDLDRRITHLAAMTTLSDTVRRKRWELLIGECRKLSYEWGLRDIESYKSCANAALI